MTEDQLRARNEQLDTFLTWFDGFADAIKHQPGQEYPNAEQWDVLRREVNILATPQARPDFVSEYVRDNNA